MKHFYKTLKRQIFIQLIYTFFVIYKVFFIYIETERGRLNPLLIIPFYALLHIITLLIYTASNHQDDKIKLKNYLLVIPIIFISSIIITIILLYLKTNSTVH